MSELIVCKPKLLPSDQWINAANTAVKVNPMNRAAVEHLSMVLPGFTPTPQHIAALTTKYWHSGGVTLTVGFLDNPAADLRARILQHMNAWAESEYHRVVRHETGHTMGFIHEHMRKALVALIDPTKAYPYFLDTQGWSKEVVDQQVLTPIEESSLTGTNPPDPDSIMCYQLPGTITFSGEPIIGGTDIDPTDYQFAAKLYPK